MAFEPAKAEQLLRDHGCTVAYQDTQSCLCIVDDGTDAWIGRGVTRETALDDVLAKLFPSHVSRLLLTQALLDETGLSLPGERLSGIHPEPIVALKAAVGAELSAPAMADEPPAVSVASPSAATPANDVESPQADASPVAETEETEPVGPATIREAHAEVLALTSQIEIDRDELALTVPRRQRLVMLGWIARGRAVQDRFPTDAALHKAIASIAKLLTGYCQLWWPGSVRALQVATRPEDILSDLPLKVDHLPHDWFEAAEVAGIQLQAIEEEDAVRGRDEHGWSDAHRLLPPPRDPDAILEELVAHATRVGGPITGKPTVSKLPDAPEFLECVRKLRWIRDSVEDTGSWGALAGRYRFWYRESPQLFAEIGRALDPDYIPERTWAHLLGRDPETIARRRLIQEVFAGVPVPSGDDAVDSAAVCAWLNKALPLADTHHASIVAAMAPFRALIATMDVSALANVDRRMRRRFAKLQKDVEGGLTAGLPPPPPEPEILPAAPDDPVDQSAMVPPSLRAPVLQKTQGRRALFVSNRADPALRDRLQDLFEFGALEWLQGDPRRRQSLEGSIAAGAYDYVLGATGFLSHTVDGQISQACRRGRVPYIRVHRGRPLACLRALARELGITSQDGSITAPQS